MALALEYGDPVLQGFALAGVPATAMAYLAEEVEASSLGRAMGVYIAGNAIGGLSGRIIAGVLAEHGGWRVAVAGVSGLAVACAVAFTIALPRSRFFTPVPLRLRVLGSSLRQNLADPGLLRLYLIGFALMGAFVTVYNYLTFRLSGAPFHLSTSVIGALFIVYLVGTYSSTMAGRLIDRLGRRVVLAIGVVVAAAGVALTLPASLLWIVAGLVLLTAGFFAAHSVASGWVGGRRVLRAGRVAVDGDLRRRAARGGAGKRRVAAEFPPVTWALLGLPVTVPAPYWACLSSPMRMRSSSTS
jgi:MFS transporter, YNFM family, putative membrane transport protein